MMFNRIQDAKLALSTASPVERDAIKINLARETLAYLAGNVTDAHRKVVTKAVMEVLDEY